MSNQSAAVSTISAGKDSVSAKVIPFPNRGISTTVSGSYSDEWIEEVLSDPEFESKVKEYIENKILAVYVQIRTEEGVKEDSPFDAIYISELQPDLIDEVKIQQIMTLKSIQDLSSGISFDDGWDD